MKLLKITISNDDDDDDGLKDPALYDHCSRKGNDVYTFLACCTIW